MRIAGIFPIVLGFQLMVSGAASAYAAEKLNFNNDIPRSSLEKIKSFSDQKIDALALAKADLNADGLYEFITRDKTCLDGAVCRFDILGETDDAVVPLGNLHGTNLLLGNEYTHGVRNILLFETPVNDFDYTLYTWHPEHSSYRKAAP